MGIQPRSYSNTDQLLGELSGQVRGLIDQINQLRTDNIRQEDRANLQANRVDATISLIREEQSRTTATVNINIANLTAQVKDLTDTTRVLGAMRDEVRAVAKQVSDMEGPVHSMLKSYNRWIAYVAVFTGFVIVLWAITGDTIKAVVNRAIGLGPHF